MSVRARVAAPILGMLGILLSLAAARDSRAADQQKVLDQIEARHKSAMTAYASGSFDKMKKDLQKAAALAEENGLGSNPIAAQTYVLTGILQVDGVEDREAGVRAFAKALKISPDVQIPKGMATTAVVTAFKQARSENSVAADEATPPPPDSAKGKSPPAKNAPAKAEAPRAEAPKAEAPREEKAPAEAEPEKPPEKSKAAASAEARERNLLQDLAMARKNEAKERSETERLQKEIDKVKADAKGWVQQVEKDKAQKDNKISDLNVRIQALEKEKPERDRQLNEAKGRVQQLEREKQAAEREKLSTDKQLADTREREKKEREAKEKVEKEKQDRDRQLVDAKGRIQQLEKEKADRDKQIADARDREKKDHDAKDALSREKQFLETRERDRKSREDQERLQRAKLAEGPDMPSRIPEPLYCALPDEAQAGADLFVHCLPQPGVRAKTLVFYYRASGVVHYNSLTLEPTRKGWYSTMVPASKVTGKLLQYYAEARDGKEAIAATNGKANSPNVLTLRSGKPGH